MKLSAIKILYTYGVIHGLAQQSILIKLHFTQQCRQPLLLLLRERIHVVTVAKNFPISPNPIGTDESSI